MTESWKPDGGEHGRPGAFGYRESADRREGSPPPDEGSERLRRIDALLDRALEVPPDARGELLDRECPPKLRGEVEELLAAEDGESLALPNAFREGLYEALGEPPLLPPGTRLGPYRVVEPLGEGGMGRVYLGERADGQFEQQVALKVMRFHQSERSGLAARFHRERQILASLDHPNIARLVDGGVSPGGQPWLAMELVRGETIDDWCDARNLGIRDRLRVFLAVARTVEAAHRRLVVHRDLKPSNILVTPEGHVKLLDFGIAKIDDPEGLLDASDITGTAHRVMTPDYASPEQFRGEEVTTVSDVYQLGLILHRLLVGRLPYSVSGLSPARAEERICVEPVGKPSSVVDRRREEAGSRAVEAEEIDEIARRRGLTPEGLRRRLRGDLDRIVQKALAKEAERRYASAAALADDVERYIEGRPVEARPDSIAYRAWRFVGRHRLAAAIATLFVTSSAVFGVFHTVQLRRERDVARAAAEEARVEATKARRVIDFLVDAFRFSSPETAVGQTMTARRLLDAGAQRIRAGLEDEPEVQAELMGVMGAVYGQLGLHEPAERLLSEAVVRWEELEGPESPRLPALLDALGDSRRFLARFGDSERVLRRSLALRQRIGGEAEAGIPEAAYYLGLLAYDRGRLDEAEGYLRAALAIDPESPGGAERLSRAKYQLARVLRSEGRAEEAETLYEELVTWGRAQDPPHILGVQAEAQLAVILQDRGQYGEAEEILRRTLAEQREFYGENHPMVAAALFNLGNLLLDQGAIEEAEELLRAAWVMEGRLLGPESVWALVDSVSVANALLERGMAVEAEGLLREALGGLERAVGPDHLRTGRAHLLLARALTESGEAEEGLEHVRKALRIFEELGGGRASVLAIEARIELAAALLAAGRRGEGEHLVSEVLVSSGTGEGQMARRAREVLARYRGG